MQRKDVVILNKIIEEIDVVLNSMGDILDENSKRNYFSYKS